MDPNNGRLYNMDEMSELAMEERKRLVHLEAQRVEDIQRISDAVKAAAEPQVDPPPLEELLAARPVLRKQAKSGNPAVKSKAVVELFALERLITAAKAATGKPRPA